MIPLSGDLLLLFGAALLGSSHCVAMCGPYVAICGARLAPAGASAWVRLLLRLLFNGGRILTYCIIGVFAGTLGQIAFTVARNSRFPDLAGIVALAAGLLAVAFGLAVMGVVRDPARLLARTGLDVLVRGGIMRVFKAPPYAAVTLLGALQGAFPCALVYGAASRAAVSGSAAAGAQTMLVFGLGTVPAIFALSVLPAALMQRFVLKRRWAGALLVAVGCLLILRGAAGIGWVPHAALW